MIRAHLIGAWLMSASCVPVMAQGCSDAGLCSVGSLRHQPFDFGETSSLQISLPLGIGDGNTMILTPTLQYERRLTTHWTLQSRLSANYATGDLGSAAGVGDIFLSGSYSKDLSADWQMTMLAGLKFPLRKANLKDGDRHLPMTYQSTLGTVDIISGVSVSSASWNFSLGWQHPLKRSNGNRFLPQQWSAPHASAYPPTNGFRRKGDLLLRATWTKAFEKLTVQAGVLNIYHLSTDTYLENLSPDSRRLSLTGSEGLTVNLTGSVWLNFGTRLRGGLMTGFPVVAREVRPDGLTRTFVISPELRWML